MIGRVVDDPALAAVLFGEKEAGAVADRLGDGRVVAPPCSGLSLHICLVKSRQHPGQEAALAAAFRLLDRLGACFWRARFAINQ
jgi:uncharacterized protein with PIN domain